MQLTVKDVNENVFREFKAEAVREGLNVGNALNIAMKFWIERMEREPKMRVLNLKPTGWGKGSEKTSEHIDKIVYGE